MMQNIKKQNALFTAWIALAVLMVLALLFVSRGAIGSMAAYDNCVFL